ncbi:hypothetical protein [Staphylococcus epidermidis]
MWDIIQNIIIFSIVITVARFIIKGIFKLIIIGIIIMLLIYGLDYIGVL